VRNYTNFRAHPKYPIKNKKDNDMDDGQLPYRLHEIKRKRLAITASLSSQKALPYEKNYYLQIVGAKLLPKMEMGPINPIKKS
jgi:hypothetical protein